MKPDAPTGPICKACGQMIMPTRDGGICGCPPRRRRDPAAVARRAIRAVVELGRLDRSGIYMLRRR